MLKNKLKQFYLKNATDINPNFRLESLDKFYRFYEKYSLSNYKYRIKPYHLSTETNISYKESLEILIYFSNEDFGLTPIEMRAYIECEQCGENIYAEDGSIICEHCHIYPKYNENDVLIQFRINEAFVSEIKKELNVDAFNVLKSKEHSLKENPPSLSSFSDEKGDINYHDYHNERIELGLSEVLFNLVDDI